MTIEEIAERYGHGEAILDLKEAIEEYAKKKCEEQRKICATMYRPGYDGESIRHDIINAPEPEFD